MTSPSRSEMAVYSLNDIERDWIVEALQSAKYEALIATDPIDDAVKIKIDGGCWSPPMGKARTNG